MIYMQGVKKLLPSCSMHSAYFIFTEGKIMEKHCSINAFETIQHFIRFITTYRDNQACTWEAIDSQ